MRTRLVSPSSRVVLVIISLLLALPAAFGAFAQPGAPPSTGQVVAHGIASLSGAPVNWRLGVVTAQPGSEATFGSFGIGFAIGYEEPVITTQLPSAHSTYLEPGDAMFHAGVGTLRVASASAIDVGSIYIDLTAPSTDPGASFIGDTFTAPAGTHDVRLTADSMMAGESGTFTPDNNLPYMVYLFEGSLQVNGSDGTDGTITPMVAGDATQLTGPVSLVANADTGARWMIASIGPQVDVPPLPTPEPAATGSLVIQLLRCPDGTDPLIAPTECVLSDIVWDITLSPQGDTDPANRRTLVNDALDIGNVAHRFTDLPAGTWVVQPDMSWMTPEQRFEITGDVVPLGGIWGVEIVAGEEAELFVYLIDPQAEPGTGSLIIEMLDCPPGTDPAIDPTGCVLATDAPNVEVSRVTQAESVIYNTLWDAVSSQAGVFTLENIESGTFLLVVEDGGLWTADAVTMGGDAYLDGDFWAVSVPDGGTAYVSMFHSPAGPPEEPDVPQGIGRLWITQIDCPSGTIDPASSDACFPSDAPWDAAVTNVENGERWLLFEDSVLVQAGTWEFTLPAGSYEISVRHDNLWDVTYSASADVLEGTTTEIVVYSIEIDGQ